MVPLLFDARHLLVSSGFLTVLFFWSVGFSSWRKVSGRRRAESCLILVWNHVTGLCLDASQVQVSAVGICLWVTP